MYDVTSTLHVQERNFDVTAVKVEVPSLIFALLEGLFSLFLSLVPSFARRIENEIFTADRPQCMHLQKYRHGKLSNICT